MVAEEMMKCTTFDAASDETFPKIDISVQCDHTYTVVPLFRISCFLWSVHCHAVFLSCYKEVKLYYNTARYLYNAVHFLQNLHNSLPIARLWGLGMGCLLWFWNVIYVLLPSSQYVEW